MLFCDVLGLFHLSLVQVRKCACFPLPRVKPYWSGDNFLSCCLVRASDLQCFHSTDLIDFLCSLYNLTSWLVFEWGYCNWRYFALTLTAFSECVVFLERLVIIRINGIAQVSLKVDTLGFSEIQCWTQQDLLLGLTYFWHHNSIYRSNYNYVFTTTMYKKIEFLAYRRKTC